MAARKCFLLLLLLFVFSFPVHAFDDGEVLIANITHSVVGGAAAEGAPANQWYSDSFSIGAPDIALSAHTNWDSYYENGENDLLTVSYGSNDVFLDYTGTGDKFENNAGEYTQATGGVDQAVAIEAINCQHESADPNFGALFRSNNGNGTVYRVVVQCVDTTADGSNIKWSKYTISNCGTTCEMAWDEDIATGTGVITYADGNCYGFAVTGTGNDTNVYVWNLGATCPGAAWDGDTTGSSNWGAYDWTDGTNPGTPVDTGNYVGIHTYSGGLASDSHLILDNWEGGDVND